MSQSLTKTRRAGGGTYALVRKNSCENDEPHTFARERGALQFPPRHAGTGRLRSHGTPGQAG
jgi:hypothetical protein